MIFPGDKTGKFSRKQLIFLGGKEKKGSTKFTENKKKSQKQFKYKLSVGSLGLLNLVPLWTELYPCAQGNYLLYKLP